MLYVTTREKYDAFTTARTLISSCGPEGGLYLPYQMPRLNEDLDAMANRSFGQNVAAVLNRFFGCGLTGWDVEFSIGRYPVRIASMGQKVVVAELWRNLEGCYDRMEQHLAARICRKGLAQVEVTSWMRIAIRIALITAVFAQLRHQGFADALDMAVSEGDFSSVMAIWYCRQMGLPICNIIIGCSDGSDVWQLLHNGQYRSTDAQEPERLIHGTLGVDAVMRLSRGEGLSLTAEERKSMSRGLHTAMVSADRRDAAIPNVYGTNAYILEPEAAAAYSALLDYRARSGESRVALILEDSNPGEDRSVAALLGLTPEKVKELLK